MAEYYLASCVTVYNLTEDPTELQELRNLASSMMVFRLGRVRLQDDGFILICLHLMTVYYADEALLTPLLERTQLLSDLKLRIRHPSQLIHTTPLRKLDQPQPSFTYPIDIKHRQIRNDPTDRPARGQWQRTTMYDFTLARFIQVVRDDDHLSLVWVRTEVHGASHPLDEFTRDHEIRQITLRRDLHGACIVEIR